MNEELSNVKDLLVQFEIPKKHIQGALFREQIRAEPMQNAQIA